MFSLFLRVCICLDNFDCDKWSFMVVLEMWCKLYIIMNVWRLLMVIVVIFFFRLNFILILMVGFI